MIQRLRIKLARWILGNHCPCYQMGYHKLVTYDNTPIGGHPQKR